ncbi:hypothetical protein SMICM17S_11583 [Streptomyces microflavus]
MQISRSGSVLLTGAVAVALAVTALPTAQAARTATAVISEVYGGSGNSGATLTRDFVELANAGATPFEGDFNDLASAPTFTALTKGKVLKPLITTLPASERYSYVFDGNSQTLDHILTSPAIRRFDYDVVHINAEFADQASDHGPQVVRVKINSLWY